MINEVPKKEMNIICHKTVQIIGVNLKKFRQEFQLTQSDVAYYIFADKSLISSMERGVQKNITLLTLHKLCVLFDKSFLDFLKKS